MARLTDEDKELILADYHTGYYTNRELAKKYNTSHVTIGKMVKELEPKHKDKVTTLIATKRALSEESYQEVTAIDKVVTEQTKHLKLINDNATKLANKLSTMTDQIDTPYDLKTLVDANDRLAITLKVADRHAQPTKIDNTNAQQTNTEYKRVTIARRSDRAE